MQASNGLGEHAANVDGSNLAALLVLALERHRVGANDAVEVGLVDVLDGIAGEHAVRGNGNDGLCAAVAQKRGRRGQRTARVAEIVNNDTDLAYAADKNHSGNFIRLKRELV